MYKYKHIHIFRSEAYRVRTSGSIDEVNEVDCEISRERKEEVENSRERKRRTIEEMKVMLNVCRIYVQSMYVCMYNKHTPPQWAELRESVTEWRNKPVFYWAGKLKERTSVAITCTAGRYEMTIKHENEQYLHFKIIL